MPPSEFLINKRRLPIPGRLTFDEMLDIERSENPCFFQFSQFFAVRLRAFMKSIIDSEATYDNEKKREEREEKRRQKKIATEI